jgi:hypothetical protein
MAGGMDIGTPERNAEQNAETRWLSYREIASIRGISRASAARMARLHRWARRKNNAGVTVCAVPLAYAEPEQERPAETQPENPTETMAVPAEVVAISALHSAIDVLRNQLIRETARSDRLQAELEHAKVEAAGVRQQVEALRQAEAARAGKGRWARLRAAWRGE